MVICTVRNQFLMKLKNNKYKHYLHKYFQEFNGFIDHAVINCLKYRLCNCGNTIPGPLGTHSRILQSEHNSDEQPSENTRDRLERHLGTIIEEIFWERTTLEFQTWVNLACKWVPRVPTAQTLWPDPAERHHQELLNGVADTRTKLLESYFFLIYILILLHFLTYIQFLCTL